MSFTSFDFLIYFPLVALLYYLVPLKSRWCYLLIVSYLFYINWQPVYAVLLFATTCVSYAFGKLLSVNRPIAAKKKLLAAGIVLCFLPLGLFKYYGFLTHSIEGVLGFLGVDIAFPELKLLMPIGISFYSFMAVGYMIDIYRKNTEPEKNFAKYMLFISFFPQVTSGPIGRAGHLLPQLAEGHRLEADNVIEGLKLMVWGYFMKLCVADRLCVYVDTVYGNLPQHNGTSILLDAILYSFQIYGDFGGYSLIAIGCARMMGIRLMENFRRPYLSKSVKEFWSRWHISLSTWFRDYLYFPLGGNRVSKARHKLNLLATFLVSGLWHGAAWNFVFWGGMHGAVQMVGAAKRDKSNTPLTY